MDLSDLIKPAVSFQSEKHVVERTTSTRKSDARFFNSMEEAPAKAITMGISSIMKSRDYSFPENKEKKL
ncbi:hypothetical protein [Neobacillus mesonae]|uniref:hypothetical protein n=1 Tax=Neobacillus mesonae TaxID=1193713 RepID=UPI002041A5D2|nr:hypothetical protein [Neobacillus mesonae]MCM3567027.1 hypothetical protein [Neobacillus mesonae]